MELVHTYQTSLDELKRERIDCIIAASGFHPRCTYIAENLRIGNAHKIVITFDEKDHAELRKQNESVFSDLGFISIDENIKSGKNIETLLKSQCNNSVADSFNILVDYSCMPKLWISTILNYLHDNDSLKEKINVFFAYTPRKFVPVNKRTVEFVGPVSGKEESMMNDKGISLIAGLDNSLDSTMKIINKVNPDRIYAFIPEPAFSEEYLRTLMKINKPLLDKIEKGNIIRYPAKDPEQINSILTSLCLELRLDSRIMIVPQGPKTFALTSLLLSLRYPDIKLWEIISSAGKQNAEDGMASGESVILKTIFSNDDEDDD